MAGENFSNRELMEAIYEIRERLVRMEEKLNNFDKLEDKAHTAEIKANEALLVSKENSKNIDGIKSNMKWSWSFVITLGIGSIIQIIYILGTHLK